MPLFKCTGCGSVENTAVGDFWNNRAAPKCSECSNGKWHGRFEKVQADPDIWEEDLPNFPGMIRSKGADAKYDNFRVTCVDIGIRARGVTK